MSPLTTKREKSIVGVDVEAGSIAATEVRVNGQVEVVRQGVLALAPGVFHEGEVTDPEALGAALKELFSTYKLGRTVRFGIANQRIAVRTLALPAIEDSEQLANAIRFQAQEHVPMPLEQAVLDWEVIGHSNGPNGERQIEVVVVAARRDMLAAVVTALRHAGLRPEGIDLSAFGMIRALGGAARAAAPPPVAPATSYEERMAAGGEAAGTEQAADGAPALPATLYCNLGDVLNLAVAQGPYCRFTRISPFGVEGIAQRLAERRQLTLEHARQWLVHVGLATPVEQVEGDPEIVVAARAVLEEGVHQLADTVRNSLNFYRMQDNSVRVERAKLSGAAVAVPGFADALSAKLALPVEAAVVAHDEDVVEHAASLAVAAGLAVDSVD